MIQLLRQENNRIYYITDTIYIIRIDVYDNYTNSFMFSNTLEVHPNYEYFTFIPFIWNITDIYFYNIKNNELITKFKIKGNKKLNEYDEYGYIHKLFQIEKGKTIQGSLHQIIGEHFFIREYKDFIDIDDGDVVFDIGFNYGIFSLFALYNNASKIYGFEPNIDIYNKINNIYPEKDRVEIFNYAVSDKYKKTIFYSTEDSVCSTISIQKNSKQYEVQCINLYDFILQQNIEKIDFLKIDCEGEEYKIFESIPDDFFIKIKKIIVEFHIINDESNINILTNKLDRLNFNWQFSNNANYNSEVGLIFAKKN